MTPGIRKDMRKKSRHPIGRSGQAVIEYILMVMVALTIVSALSYGMKRVLLHVWMQMACEITAPCPHCQKPPELKATANQVAPGSCR
jgi:hypothetical protein